MGMAGVDLDLELDSYIGFRRSVGDESGGGDGGKRAIALHEVLSAESLIAPTRLRLYNPEMDDELELEDEDNEISANNLDTREAVRVDSGSGTNSDSKAGASAGDSGGVVETASEEGRNVDPTSDIKLGRPARKRLGLGLKARRNLATAGRNLNLNLKNAGGVSGGESLRRVLSR
jgi:hypothetical protein